MMLKISLINIGASPMEGSSKSINLGLAIKARPTTVICCSPPLMKPAVSPRFSFSRGK